MWRRLIFSSYCFKVFLGLYFAKMVTEAEILEIPLNVGEKYRNKGIKIYLYKYIDIITKPLALLHIKKSYQIRIANSRPKQSQNC